MDQGARERLDLRKHADARSSTPSLCPERRLTDVVVVPGAARADATPANEPRTKRTKMNTQRAPVRPALTARAICEYVRVADARQQCLNVPRKQESGLEAPELGSAYQSNAKKSVGLRGRCLMHLTPSANRPHGPNIQDLRRHRPPPQAMKHRLSHTFTNSQSITEPSPTSSTATNHRRSAPPMLR